MTRPYNRKTPMTAEPETVATQGVEATPKTLRRRRASTGGFATKLDAPQRPGYVRRFVLNDPSRLMHLQDLGYDFVQDRAGSGEARTEGDGTRIARHAGKDESGRPQQLILMETPQEEYAAGLAEKEDRLKPFEEAIRRGDDPTGGLSKGELYDAGRSTINNSSG